MTFRNYYFFNQSIEQTNGKNQTQQLHRYSR